MKKSVISLMCIISVMSTMLMGCSGGTASTTKETEKASETKTSVTESDANIEMEPINLSVATSYAEGSDYINRLQIACDNIGEKTNGNITFTIYAGNQLGSTMDCFEQMMNGANMMSGVGMANLSTYVSEAAIPGYPYVCNSWEDMQNLMESDWWAEISEQLVEEWNIQPVMTFSCGYRNMIGSVPVRSAEDLSKVITRIGLGTIGQEFIAATGGTPTTTSTFQDCYSSLQTGMFELCEGDLELLYTSALYEVSDYVSITHHMMNPAVFFINNDIWTTIPAEYQQIILDEFALAGDEIFNTYVDKEADWIAQFKAKGVEVIPYEEVDVESLQATIPDILKAEGIDENVYQEVLDAVAGR